MTCVFNLNKIYLSNDNDFKRPHFYQVIVVSFKTKKEEERIIKKKKRTHKLENYT